jgi:hypothetical protein
MFNFLRSELKLEWLGLNQNDAALVKAPEQCTAWPCGKKSMRCAKLKVIVLDISLNMNKKV